MRDPQPVVVDVPNGIVDSSFLHNPDYFDIGIEKDRLVINYKNGKTILYNLKQLDSMVDANGDGAMNGKVVLRANNKDDYKRVNEIIQLLKSDSIQTFNLHTPLEGDPSIPK